MVKDTLRKTRRKYPSEKKALIALEALRGEDSIAGLCRWEGIPPSPYCPWSKDFLGARKKRLVADKALEANS